ncbi:tetratricopeptide repeat protein [Gimesia chilikensis]|uniref:Tetratricopeptide repeat protein n=1 Tax=Gimesia chilikensis TaxID=2605989 RepID=A0A517PWD7_9PLAN|nr:hypothetical protein [Gimesia chilikensis]QDT23682.1 hypothetical protein HG66A1_55050 [Gimesia chilikensis]
MKPAQTLITCLILFLCTTSLAPQLTRAADSDIKPIKFNLERKKRGSTETSSRLPPGPKGTIGLIDGTPVFGLEYISSHYLAGGAQKEPGPLSRELVRQAFLIAAREHLGCRTRDALLGESLPQKTLPQLGRVGVVSSTYWPLGSKGYLVFGLAVYQEKGAERQFLLEKNFKIDGKETDILPQMAEAMALASQNEFPALLKKLGVPERPLVKSKYAALPESLLKDQHKLDSLTQYQIVRGLHQFLDENGPNWKAYLQLAQAYGHLGVLTEFYWSDFSSVCKARGLLYALRAKGTASTPATEYEAFAKTHLGTRTAGEAIPQATALLAYLQAIYGRHADAAQTLAEYEKAVKERRWKPASTMQAPLYYAKAIANYDLEALRNPQEKTAPQLGPFYLAALFEASGLANQTMENYFAALEQNPDSLRLSDGLSLGRTVGHMRISSDTLRQNTVILLNKKVSELSTLSPDVKSVLATYKQKSSTNKEIAAREDLTNGLSRLAAEKEAQQEFTSEVLAHMLLERSFTNAEVTVDMARNYLGLDPTPTIEFYKSICSSHQFKHLIQLQQTNSNQAMALLRQVDQSLPSNPAPAFRHMQLMVPMTNVGMGMAQLPMMATNSRFRQIDYTYTCLLPLRQVAGQFYIPMDLEDLPTISPKSEAAQLVPIENKKTTLEVLLELEKKHPESVLIYSALAARYEKEAKENKKREEDLQRVLAHLTTISQDDTYYSQLADLYQKQNKEDEWVKLTRKMLELPSPTLKTVHWEVQLAYWHARKDEKDKAFEHAEHAFQSGSTESFQCLIALHSKYGDFDKANKLFSDMTDRYSARSPDWLRWCLCHNKGDAKAAQSKVEAYFQKVNARSTPGYQSMMFHFYTIINEPQKASLALMTTRNLSRVSPATLLLGSCVADQTGNKAERDRLVQATVDLEKNPVMAKDYAVWIEYAKKLQLFLKRPDKRKLNKELVTDLTEKSNSDFRQNLELVSAYFLTTNRLGKEAAPLLLHSAVLMKDFPLTVNVISRQVLRKQGMTVGPGNEGLKTKE